MRYQTIETLRHYVLVSQNEPRVERFTRDDGEWRYSLVAGIKERILLPAVHVTLALADLYERVTFP